MELFGHKVFDHQQEGVTPAEMSAHLDTVEASMGLDPNNPDRLAEKASEDAWIALEKKDEDMNGGSVVIKTEDEKQEVASVSELPTPQDPAAEEQVANDTEHQISA